MRSKLVYEQREKTYVVVFETGEEVTAGLLQFAKDNHLSASSFTAIGGFGEVTLGYFDIGKRNTAPSPLTSR